MSNTRKFIPVAGLLVTMAAAGYAVVQMAAQEAAVSGDFSNAAVVEVHDAQAQVILRGNFETVTDDDEDDDDVERKAALQPTGGDADAAGEAEVEFTKAKPAEQELEVSVRNVQPGAVLTFVIDGKQIGTATVDGKGRAELELDVTAAVK